MLKKFSINNIITFFNIQLREHTYLSFASSLWHTMKHFLGNTRALLPSTKAHWLSEMQFLRSRLGLSTNNLAIVFYCTLHSLFGQNLGSLSAISFFGIRTMDGWFLFSSKIFCSKKWLIDLAKSLLTMLQKSWKKVALYPLGQGLCSILLRRHLS